MFEIFPIRAFSDNYIWTLVKDEEVTVVDPGDSEPVITLLQEKNLTLSNVIITHHHFDHTGGIKKLSEIYDCNIYGPSEGHIQGINKPIKDNQEFVISNTVFKAFATPGHTLDHLSYFVNQENEPFLLSGDTLFSGGCGRLFEGTPLQMYESLSKFTSLPINTKVYCTHEYTESNLKFALAVEPNNTDIKEKFSEVVRLRSQDKETLPSTIGEELKVNPFMRCNELDVKKAAENFSNQKLSEPHEILGSIRNWKDNF